MDVVSSANEHLLCQSASREPCGTIIDASDARCEASACTPCIGRSRSHRTSWRSWQYDHRTDLPEYDEPSQGLPAALNPKPNDETFVLAVPDKIAPKIVCGWVSELANIGSESIPEGLSTKGHPKGHNYNLLRPHWQPGSKDTFGQPPFSLPSDRTCRHRARTSAPGRVRTPSP